MGWRIFSFLLLSALAYPIYAEQILGADKAHTVVKVSHPPTRRWHKGERVCLVRADRTAHCGSVFSEDATGAVIKLEKPGLAISNKDRVFAYTDLRPKGRTVSSTSTASVGKTPRAPYTPFNVTAGANFGLTYLFSAIHLQYSITPKLAIGLMPLYSANSVDTLSASAFGGAATLGYYDDTYYQGLWVQTGVGATSISVTDGALSEKGIAILAFAAVGWRFSLVPHLNLGVAAGGQYVTNPNLTLVDVRFSSLNPLFMIDLGYNF